MSLRSKSLLFLLRRCAAVRQPQLVTSFTSGGGFIQQRTWTSVTRRGCVHGICQVQPAVEIGQFRFCNKAESSCVDEYPPLPAYQSDEPEKKEVFIVQVNGLPWSCSAQDLMEFFSECRIRDGQSGIHLTVDRLGRPSGRAFIEMEHREDVSKALEQHRQYLGSRYVEVFEVTTSDAEAILKKALAQVAADDSTVVRLRGLPFTCTEDNIVQFFTGLDIVENGITFVTDFTGRRSGEAFVQFSSHQEAVEALQKDREFIGNRYIKVFRSKNDEINPCSEIKMTLGPAQIDPQSENTIVSAPQCNPETESIQSFETTLHDTYLRDSFSKATSQEAKESDLSSDDELTPQPVQQSEEPEKKDVFIVRVKGLPWSTSAEEIMHFFSDCRIRGGLDGIHLTLDRRGRPSGRGFIEMEDEEDVSRALEKHRQYIGERYVEVYEVTNSDAEAMLKKNLEPNAKSEVVRLRGLPFTCTEADVVQFFRGLDIVENGITFVTDFTGRRSGEAFVQFSSLQEAVEALQKDREFIGNRYIKVFSSSSNEIHPNWRMRANMAFAHQPVSDPLCGSETGSLQSSETLFHYQQSRSPSAQASQDDAEKAEASSEDEYTPSRVNQSVEEPDRDVFIVQVKGLPWSCSAEDLMQFFSDCRIRDGLNGIHLTLDRRGRPSGRGFIEMEDEEDVSRALEKHRQYIGERYVEVYEVTNGDAEAMLNRPLKPAADSRVVRLRGLPFSCTEDDIVQFFRGLNIVENGITFITDRRGRPTEAYVQFPSQREADEALQRDKEFIGNRYIEVLTSASDESPPSWKSRNNSASAQKSSQSAIRTLSIPKYNTETGSPQISPAMLHCVHMRGLPFRTSGEDIVKFFSPLPVSSILIACGADGRPNGEADVHFSCHQDAVAAMSRDKHYIGERFIELFLNSTRDS
ncbi:uncharacterized protein LOC103397816 [Cynoglossus semilaevis]|nr:uncharacterized protein LOC103397816 [Cynoglossus semilaevis]XP_008334431.1 uncharacterized protein LOC103397816 [Cynoglossus semilaevis]